MQDPAKGKLATKSVGTRIWPWNPRFWHGMGLGAWLGMLRRNRFHISPTRLPLLATVSAFAPFNSLFGMGQRLLYGRRLRHFQIDHDPIFIVGHWRSGTTLLHELLVLDDRFTYPDTYAAFAPDHFLISAWLFKPLFWFVMPSRRPMDNMVAGWHLPQEDEFALCNMGVRSPYATLAFPHHPPQDQEYLTLDGLPANAVAAWQESLREFIKRLMLHDNKPVVLKSPPHTARLRVLLDTFPNAKFVHISRDPFALFASTVNLWRRLYETQGLQAPPYEGIEPFVFDTFTRMYAAYERDRLTVPAGQLCEVRYEDLIAQPLDEMRRVYDEIGLGGFEQIEPKLTAYFAEKADYKTNKYTLSPALRDEVARRWASYIERYGYAAESAAR